MKKKLTTDLFGLAFRDFLDGQKDGIIKVRTKLSGFTEQEELPVSYFFRTVNEMPLWEKIALDACRGRVLDAGAGAGTHSLELQKRGHEVYAIDISQGAVDAMSQRGIKQTRCVNFLDFSGDRFDTLLFLMNGIGMATDLKGLKAILTHARGLLAPGGKILLESTDIMYMFRLEDGSVLLPMGNKYYGEVEYKLSYKNHCSKPFPWLFADMDNLCSIAGECGFMSQILFQGETDNYLVELSLRECY